MQDGFCADLGFGDHGVGRREMPGRWDSIVCMVAGSVHEMAEVSFNPPPLIIILYSLPMQGRFLTRCSMAMGAKHATTTGQPYSGMFACLYQKANGWRSSSQHDVLSWRRLRSLALSNPDSLGRFLQTV